MTAASLVRYQPGRVARITLDRPEFRNAQSAQLLEELDDAFRLAARDPSVKVIVMDGAGESFSSGHDLGTPDQRGSQALVEPAPLSTPGDHGERSDARGAWA